MKRIELTIADDAAMRVLAALAEHELITLNVATIDVDTQLVDSIADFVEREGQRLQNAGRRNSALTGQEIAAGIRNGDHDREPLSLLEHRVDGNAGGGGGTEADVKSSIVIASAGIGGGGGAVK